LSKEHLKNMIGCGVAGNFANHLDQAGESADFVNVKTKDEKAPKGMFPFYIPNSNSFLGTYPLSSKIIRKPENVENLQVEPEIALICEVEYNENKKVVDLVAKYFTAYNDCSIRRPNAKKISEKKNWGEETKGISSDLIELDKFENGGVLESYHIASFVKRDGAVYEYGNDSAATTYSYFYNQLKEWMIDQLNNQKDFGPLEDLSEILKEANYPKQLIVSIGATSYTEFGKENFLEVGDEIFIFAYDSNSYSNSDIRKIVESGDLSSRAKISLLHQKVY
jgi:hypothetical protein